MYRTLLLLSLVIVGSQAIAQQTIIIAPQDSLSKSKVLHLSEGDLIDLIVLKYPEDTLTKRSRKTKSYTGRILHISNDSLILKKFMSRKMVFVQFENAAAIRNSNFTPYSIGVFAIAATIPVVFPGASLGFYLPGNLHWFVVGITPLAVDYRIISRWKYVNEDFYKRKNRWELTVE